MRKAAADYILTHPDDFLPFLPSVGGEDAKGSTEGDGLMTSAQFRQYCSNIENTSQWGGEPEILALSRVFGVPIHVVQGGRPSVVEHSPGPDNQSAARQPAVISYHRKLFGLGEVREHFNFSSLATEFRWISAL